MRMLMRQTSTRFIGTANVVLSASNSSADRGEKIAASTTFTKPFEAIPAAKGLPFLGTILDYTPLRDFKVENIFDLWIRRHREYGNIFREKMLGSEYMVFCNSKDDCSNMLRNDGQTPNRHPVPYLSKLKSRLGMVDSFFNFTGEEWHRFRSVIDPAMLRNDVVWKYFKQQREVCRELVEFIASHLDDKGEVPDFKIVLDKWSMELAGAFIFDVHLGLLGRDDDPSIEELVKWNAKLFVFVGRSLHGIQLWRFFDTKEFLEATESLRKEVEFVKGMAERQRQIKSTTGQTVNERITQSPLTDQEAFSTLVDLYLGAIDTTSKAAALVLYCLTVNPESQELLRKEVQEYQMAGSLNGRMLESMKYMNAFLKEVFRVQPFSFAFSRWYTKDIILSGFRIPAGTLVVNTANSTQNMNPHYFPDPYCFRPERWLASECKTKTVLTGPFGIGRRACPGRRFAMQEIRLLLFEVLQTYRVEYHHKPIVSLFRATGVPSEEPQFKFIPIK